MQILLALGDYKDAQKLLTETIANLKEDMSNLSDRQREVVMNMFDDNALEFIETSHNNAEEEDTGTEFGHAHNQVLKNVIESGSNLLKKSRPYIDKAKRSITGKITDLMSNSQKKESPQDDNEELEIPNADNIAKTDAERLREIMQEMERKYQEALALRDIDKLERIKFV